MIICYLFTGASFVLLLGTGMHGLLQTRFTILEELSHLNMALIAIIIYLFTEVLIMFFFIGTGSSVKDFVRQHRLDSGIYDRVKAIKHVLFPGTMMSITLFSVAFIVGGAVDRSGLPSWVHGVLFVVAMVHFVKLLPKQNLCFRKNTEIFRDLTEAYEARRRAE
ncbi:MAG: hypothetical protein O2923_04995 [Verrucomicrobia bacterium]|nr:hypothetical protein [Verrucomicrobiota bacterium]MDA1086792.1 hypothetical protein [Verrucomicrobiota bacterium]